MILKFTQCLRLVALGKIEIKEDPKGQVITETGQRQATKEIQRLSFK